MSVPKNRLARAAALALVLALTPALAARAAADCSALDARFPDGAVVYKPNLNDNLGDYGTLFQAAKSLCCAEKVQKLFYKKLETQLAEPNGFENRWLGGGDIYFISAIGLQLGAQRLLPPSLDAMIEAAIQRFNHVPNCSFPTNTCMDDLAVSAAGFAWAAAYEAKSGRPGLAAQHAGMAQDFFHRSFSQTESVCLQTAGTPCNACDVPLVSENDLVAIADLETAIANDEVDVLVFNHDRANPNYGLGLFTSLSTSLAGLRLAGSDFKPTRLEAVLAQGMFREAQHHASPSGMVCGNAWDTQSCQAFDAACSPRDCGDPDTTKRADGTQEGPYSADMYPVLDFINDKFKIDNGLPLIDPNGYQFDGFCDSRFMTENSFMSDGRLSVYRDLAWTWPYQGAQPALQGPSSPETAPEAWIDSPAHNQTITGTTQFFGWAADGDSAVSSLRFELDGQPATLQGSDYGGTRTDVCAAKGYLKCSDCPVGWGGSFSPAGLANGTHVLRVIATDPAGNTGVFDRSFVVNLDQPPAASFTSSCNARTCSFDGSGSTDDHGISSYAWSFGDGASGSGSLPSHTYGTTATFTVTLTVTDTTGKTGSVSHTVMTSDPDLPPTAFFTTSCTARTCSFNASGSSDDHGIASYFWSFGDGATGSGLTASHTYATSATFTVTLTVNDTAGQAASTTRTVRPSLPPVASFTTSCTGRTCSFNGSGSSDDLGIVTYLWNFGDGASSAAQPASHTYATSGTFTATLTVTDASGQTASTTRTVNPNLPPTASFTTSCTARTCSVNAAGSSDDQGISSYAWNFGDGATASGVTASRTYATSGTFTITLTVTDTSGQTASTTRTVTPSLPPAASFTASCASRTCSFNAGGSTDDLGIASYTWNFGDGATGSGLTASHTYATTATFTVTLTVADASGQTASTTRTVSPNLAPTASFTVACTGRSCNVSGSASSDDQGITSYTWNFGDGSPAASGVTSSHLYATNGTYTITLTVTDAIGQSGQTTRSVSAVDNPPYAFFTTVCQGRTCAAQSESSSDDVGIVNYTWAWGDGQTTTGGSAVSAPSHTYAANGTYTIVLTLRDVANQTASVSHPVSPTDDPIPVFTFNCVGRNCTVNATGSFSPAGITNYHWLWGDETTSDTPSLTAQHTFAYSDAFSVTLTVTDNAGLEGVITKTRRVGMADSVGYFEQANGKFHLRSGTVDDKYTFFLSAAAGTQPVAGDWNGDGIRTGGKFADATGEFALSNSLSKTGQDLAVDLRFTLQAPGTGRIPIIGDWNGDGVETVGLYLPATREFYLRNSNTTGPADVIVPGSGAPTTWRPLTGDWNSDGIDSVGLYDPATSTFYMSNSLTATTADYTFVFGTPGLDLWPLAGDWDGNGSTTIGTYQQSNHQYQLRNLNSAGTASSQFTSGTAANTLPLAGYWYMP
jgi:PKD repeat protein